jgi:hypothetical protein
MQAVTLCDLQDIDDVSYALDFVLYNRDMHVHSHSINDLLDQDSLGLDLTYLLLGYVIAFIMVQTP